MGVKYAPIYIPTLCRDAHFIKGLESLKKNGKRVLIAIDEVTSTPCMREFVHSFQMFVRQDLPVFLIMTGLYQNIDLLQNEKGLTFLYRAPKITLSPLRSPLLRQLLTPPEFSPTIPPNWA